MAGASRATANHNHAATSRPRWNTGWRGGVVGKGTLLSMIRNTLYLIGDRDTSTLPSRPERLRQLADAMHHDSTQSLVEEVDRARRRIRKVFDRRFF